MRWAVAPQTLVSDSQPDGRGRSSRPLHLVGQILGVISSPVSDRAFCRMPPCVAGPGRTSRQHLAIAGFETLQRFPAPTARAPPVGDSNPILGLFNGLQ